MIKVVDFILSGVAIWLATYWGDGKTSHMWIVAIVIGVANLVSYIRGSMIRN